MARPTMEDVAARAGVSRALVSLVMRQAPNVSPERRQRVLDAASELGYRPNVLARNLASTRTMTIGVVLDDLHNPWFAQVFDGIEGAAADAGYQILLNTGAQRPGGEERALDALLDLRVDGIIAAGPRLPTRRLEAVGRQVPFVVVGRSVRSPTVDSVNNDEATGARLAVEHLVSLGHERIAHIDGGPGAGASARRAGYERAMAACGLAEHVHVAAGDFTEAAGHDAMAELWSSDAPPTAVFCANDLIAIGALDSLDEAGVAVPEEISLVGYDDTPMAALKHLSLTTVNQPTEQMGALAMIALSERLDGSRVEAVRHVLEPTLVERDTAVPPMKR